MARPEIEKICKGILRLINEYRKEKNKIEQVETFFCDMITNPGRFPGISCPLGSDTSMGFLRQSIIHYYTLKIYTELESLYNYIITDFDPSYSSGIWSINIVSFTKKILNQTFEGQRIGKNKFKKAILESIITSSDFNNTINPVYSTIQTIIEWRGANAHHNTGSHNINLDQIGVDFREI